MRRALALVVPVLLTFILAWAAFLKPPWHDELYTLWLSGQSPAAIVAQLRHDSGPPLHYFLMHLWGALVGHGVEGMRLFSVLCIVGAGLLLRRALEIEGPGPVGPWVVPLFCLMPLSLYYGVEARAYALILCLTAALLEGMLARRHPLWLGGLTALLLYTHSLAFLLLPFLLAAPLLLRNRRLWWPPLIGLAAWIPYLPILLGQPRDSIAWMQTPPSWVKIVHFLAGFAPCGPVFDLFPFPRGLLLPATFAGLTVLLAALALGTRGTARMAVAGFCLTTLALFGLSAGLVNLYYPSRGEVLAWPFLAMAGFALIQRRLKPLPAHLLLGALTLVLAAQAALWITALPQTLPWESIGREIRACVKPGDRILVPGPWALSLDYYLHRAGGNAVVEIFPPDQAVHPGWYWCRSLTKADLVLLEAAASRESGTVFLFHDTTQPCARLAAKSLALKRIATFGPFRLDRVEGSEAP